MPTKSHRGFAVVFFIFAAIFAMYALFGLQWPGAQNGPFEYFIAFAVPVVFALGGLECWQKRMHRTILQKLLMLAPLGLIGIAIIAVTFANI